MDMGWTRYQDSMERSRVEACRNAALAGGNTIEDADNCDDKSVGCPDCPFIPLEYLTTRWRQG